MSVLHCTALYSTVQCSTVLKTLCFSVESCQTDVCEVKRDMIAIKHEIDSVQLVKDEIDDIRESLDRLEAESQRRKNKLLEQVGSREGRLQPLNNLY